MNNFKAFLIPEDYRQMLVDAPPEGCCCHISPPCSACTDRSDLPSLDELKALAAAPDAPCPNCNERAWKLGAAGLCFTCTTGEADASEDYELTPHQALAAPPKAPAVLALEDQPYPAKYGEYLPDATDFTGIDRKEPRIDGKGTPVECPKCHGHGKWNMRRNDYGPGRHFQCFCTQCNGWGFVAQGSVDETCIHTRQELSVQECRERGIRHYGKCWHVYACTICGSVASYDSSD